MNESHTAITLGGPRRYQELFVPPLVRFDFTVLSPEQLKSLAEIPLIKIEMNNEAPMDGER